MIELTIKTLDSQNHKFSVPDTFTILELKEFIAAQVNVEVVQQRLIFHGRVLSNETKLADIGIDGKVMHLVQKVPLLSTTTSGSTSSATTNTTSRSEPNAELGFRGFHEHDPTIFSIGIPPELMQARELPNALSGRNNGNMSRESVALDMIRRGNEILNRLEHPLPNTPQSSEFNAEYREGVRGADDSESESSGTDLFDSEYYDSLSFESELSDTESSTESNMQPNEVNVIHLDENNVVIAVIPPCPAALPIPSLRPINQNETDTSAESEFSNVPVGGSTNQSSF